MRQIWFGTPWRSGGTVFLLSYGLLWLGSQAGLGLTLRDVGSIAIAAMFLAIGVHILWRVFGQTSEASASTSNSETSHPLLQPADVPSGREIPAAPIKRQEQVVDWKLRQDFERRYQTIDAEKLIDGVLYLTKGAEALGHAPGDVDKVMLVSPNHRGVFYIEISWAYAARMNRMARDSHINDHIRFQAVRTKGDLVSIMVNSFGTSSLSALCGREIWLPDVSSSAEVVFRGTTPEAIMKEAGIEV